MIRLRMVRLLQGAEQPAMMVLMDEDQGQALATPVSAEEAAALVASFGQGPRPGCHDVLLSVVTRLGGAIRRVVIHDLRGDVLIGQIELETPHGIAEIDCRPGDGVALALRAGCDLFIAEAVLAQAGVPATLFETSS